MKRYIQSTDEFYRPVSGTIYETGEKCKMQPNGYWVGSRGQHITSYERVDVDQEYDEKGRAVFRQYSMNRKHQFFIETEDIVY